MLWILAICLAACHSPGNSYYVDSIAGDDTNSGTSPQQAWKSLERLNEHEFMPGDRILFKSGTEYIGSFCPHGKGSEKHPIVVDKYGKGEKPILNGDGRQIYTILLKDNPYWKISNLEVMNKGKEALPGRKGIWIKVEKHSASCHIELSKLVVRDVMGDVEGDVPGGGIYFSSGRDSLENGFLDITMDSCYVYRCRPWGVYMDAPRQTVVMKDNFIR